jgi:hypothetical protein
MIIADKNAYTVQYNISIANLDIAEHAEGVVTEKLSIILIYCVLESGIQQDNLFP